MKVVLCALPSMRVGNGNSLGNVVLLGGCIINLSIGKAEVVN